jgi:HAD superfamily hydrolase (TIGR01509 family)
MKDVYIFDLDGTLVDSMPYFTKAILSIPEEEGLTFDPTEMIKIVTPLGYTKSAEYYRTLGAESSVEDMVHRIEKKLVYEYSNNIFTKPGVTAYVKALHKKGARLFVLTASPHLVTDVCLQHNGIFDLFEQVWSVEDFALSKSDTRIFFEVAKTVGCKPEEVHYFDDSLIALANAKKAGYRTYAVYDAQTPAEVERMKAEYDVYVGSFEELNA